METKTTTETKKNSVKATAKNADEKKATLQKKSATTKASDAKRKVTEILSRNGKSVVKRLQHAQILAQKFENMSGKYDDLTHFIAGKDNDNSSMKFASENGYSFTLNNPAVIAKVLELIEGEFSTALKNSENELLDFQV